MNKINSNTSNSKFGITSVNDYLWVADQIPCVQKLWAICWGNDPFGDRWVLINNVSLPESTFRKARKILKDVGMFDFKPDKHSSDNRKTSNWLIRNLKGAKAHLYKNPVADAAHELAISAHQVADTAHYLAGNLPETLAAASFQNPSLLDPVQDQETNSIPTSKKQGLVLPLDQKNKPDQVILDPCVPVQARESSFGDDATLDATHPRLVEVGIEHRHRHSISATQKTQEGNQNHQQAELVMKEKTEALEPVLNGGYSDRMIELMNNPIDPVLLKEPFSPFVSPEQAKTFGRNLRGLSLLSSHRRLDKSEIRTALNQDWLTVKERRDSQKLLELLRIYIGYNFQEVQENIYVSTLYKHVG